MANGQLNALVEQVYEELLTQLGMILARIDCPDSGRIAETMLQLLPQKYFDLLCTLVVGHDKEELPRQFAASIAVKIAQKLGLNIDQEALYRGTANVLSLIHCEQMRRNSFLDYLWPNDIFSAEPGDKGFSKLTDKGLSELYTNLLNNYQGTVIQ